MIDLSHLTEEEQGMIMTVLRRDAELKKAEEERVRKLEKILNSGSETVTERKYLTGEWFYEAKSRRHMDKIHGSEIILASMKPRKAGLDGSLRVERSKAPSSRGPDIVPPPKPARSLDARPPRPRDINSDAEKDNLNSPVRSPRTPRPNPFNQASLIVVEPPENIKDMSSSRDHESTEIEPVSPLKSHAAAEASQTSGSFTSEGSSAGFRPVPKKRTFISRRNSSQSDSNIPVLEAQVGSLGVVPAPRRSLQRRSSGSSKQSHPKGLEEMPKKSVVSSQVSQFAPPPKSLVENSQQPLCDVSEVSCNFSSERERHPAPLTTDRSVYDKSSDPQNVIKSSHSSIAIHNLCSFRPDTRTRTDLSTDREIPQKSDERFDQREREAVNTVSVHTGSVQGSDRENNSSVGTSTRQGELSLTLNTVDSDPPVSYDLHFIDKSDKKMQTKSNPKSVFKLSTQTSCPTGEDEDSIAKVLDWFNRSTDSLDWPKTEDVQGLKKGSDKCAEIRQFRGEDSSRKYADNVISDRKTETFEMKRNHLQRQTDDAKELRSTDRIGNKALAKTQEEVKKDTGERMWSQEVEDVYDENQAAKISNLKSFWEKSNSGPKILIGKSITPSDKGQKAGHLSVERDEEKVSDMPSVPGIYNGKGSYDKYTSNGLEREQQVVISSQKDTGDNVPIYNDQEVDSLLMKTSTQRNHNDPSSSDYLKVAASPQVVDKRASDTKVLSVTKLSPQLWTVIQSRLSPESDSVSLVKPKPQPDTISQYKETLPQDELSKNISVSHLDTDLQTRDSPESDKLYSSRNIPYMEYKQGGGEVQITPKTQIRRGSSEDLKRREIEDHSVPSSMSLKRKEDTSNKDRVNSPHSNRRGSSHQESTAEKIKQLKSFWEQERNNPVLYTGKARALGEGKVTRGANQAKLTKRFTKSEYDLSSMGNYSDSDEEGSERRHQYFNQRLDKLSPSLGTSRIQFNTLRVFWDEATSDNKGSLTFDKPKSPKRKEPMGSQLTDQELKGGDPEVYRVSPAFEKTRPAVVKSSPPSQGRSKSPHDRQTGFGTRAANDAMSNYTTAEQQRESKRSSKDTNRDEKSTKPQSGSGKEARRKDTSSSRGNSMRRARSMFALSAPDETDQSHFQVDGSPVHSQSRKQRQNAERAAGGSSRSSEETENLTPRARACVPKDYRHYLGMTDETSVHTSLAPAVKSEGSDGKSGYGFDLVRASTPVSSEERYSSRRSSKTSQRPLWSMYSSSDTGPECLSSTSETWSTSRNSSTRDNEDQSQHPVRKALWRAEARPKNLTKSMEDITAPLSPRQERRPDPTADIRRISDVSSVASPSSSLFSDPEHLKKMSKSVPSFLQKEDVGRDTDSTCDESDHRGRLMMGNSLTDLTGSPDMASVSSLSGSVMTMYSGDFGNVEVQGNIQFSINYVPRLREFHIFVAECRDLAAVDPKRGRSDPPRQEEYVDDSKTRPKPSKSGLETKTSLEYYNTVLKYVKSYLLPDKAHLGKRKTSVKKKTLNPTFNEILRYRVRMEYLRTQTLILSVWHHDTFGRNSFLGEVDVDLSKWDFDHTQKNYLPLKARTTPTLVPSNGQGEMRLALRFLPQIIHSEGLAKEAPNAGEVHIWVKECKNLPLVRATIDPFVKCFVLPDTSRKSRQKTRVLRRTADPAFNHTMVYDGIREADLSEACVELTVWDRDRLASNLLGGLRLGVGTGKSFGAAVDWMDSTPFEMALWERMKASPNEWVEDILPLRMMSSAKTAFK